MLEEPLLLTPEVLMALAEPVDFFFAE